MFVHVVILLLLVWLWRPVVNGTQGDRDRPIGIAVVHHNQGSTEYFLEAGGKGITTEAEQPSSAAMAKSIPATLNTNAKSALSVEELLGEFAGIGKSSLGVIRRELDKARVDLVD